MILEIPCLLVIEIKLDWAGLHCPKGSKNYLGLEETMILSLGRGLGCQPSSGIEEKA